MMYRCSECGATIPEDSDFCYRCGTDKSKAFPISEEPGAEVAFCPSCRTTVDPGAEQCPECGSALERKAILQPVDNAIIALFAGLLPGFLEIFGLGHIMIKRYKRAAVFLAMSVLINYINYGHVIGKEPGIMGGVFVFLSLAVFLVQMLDLMSLVYGGPGLSFRMSRR